MIKISFKVECLYLLWQEEGDNVHDWIVKIFSLRSFLYLLFWYLVSKSNARWDLIMYCVTLCPVESAQTSVILLDPHYNSVRWKWGWLFGFSRQVGGRGPAGAQLPNGRARKRTWVFRFSFRLFPLDFTVFSIPVKYTQVKKKKKIIYRVDLSKTVILNLFGAVSSFVHGLLWNWLKSFGSFSKKKHKHVPSLHFSATRDSNRADSDLGPKRTRFLLWKSRPFWRFLMMPEGSIFKVCQKRWLSTVRSVRGHSALPHLWSLLYITLILMCNVVLSSDSRRFRPHRPAPHPQKACACPGLCGEFGELSW